MGDCNKKCYDTGIPFKVKSPNTGDVYRLKKSNIGCGSSGCVYKATNQTGEKVAIKVMPLSKNPSVSREYNFIREGLVHPYIVPCFDDFSFGAHYYVVMEHSPVGTLHDLFEHSPEPMTSTDIVRIFAQMTTALTYMKENGIRVTDFKPENILLTRNMDAMLADFGSTHFAEDRFTCPPGTIEYMAPERQQCYQDCPHYNWFADHDTGFASDVFSLGCTVYQMCTFKDKDTFPTYCRDFAANPTTIARYDQNSICNNLQPLLAGNPAERPSYEQLIKTNVDIMKQYAAPGLKTLSLAFEESTSQEDSSSTEPVQPANDTGVGNNPSLFITEDGTSQCRPPAVSMPISYDTTSDDRSGCPRTDNDRDPTESTSADTDQTTNSKADKDRVETDSTSTKSNSKRSSRHGHRGKIPINLTRGDGGTNTLFIDEDATVDDLSRQIVQQGFEPNNNFDLLFQGQSIMGAAVAASSAVATLLSIGIGHQASVVVAKRLIGGRNVANVI